MHIQIRTDEEVIKILEGIAKQQKEISSKLFSNLQHFTKKEGRETVYVEVYSDPILVNQEASNLWLNSMIQNLKKSKAREEKMKKELEENNK